ncbi:MAG: hypothetical protein A2Z20_07560 [Bdellovibrionales bacterium RBG_16_40_8]|nr:MAG: hypothetical protein A2Z20_07560 [Bdellovibrionales bacterium RBG_16_40_8]
MTVRHLQWPLWLLLASQLLGCAGPSSPFGGLEFGFGDGLLAKFAEYSTKPNKDNEKITFSPKRQMLHLPADLEVEILPNDSLNKNIEVHVVYNNRDITHAFHKNSNIDKPTSPDDMSLKFITNKLRLSPSRKHKIEFYTRTDKSSQFIQSTYLPPQCLWKNDQDIFNTIPFTPQQKILELIDAQAKKYDINKTLLAGLIAQESSFELDTVSRSRAIGLTQVTPLAAQEIEKIHKSWQRYAPFDRQEPKKISSLISHKIVTEKQDWRLNLSRSIEGGATYLQYLDRYWANEDNAKLLSQLTATDYSTVILASYNSGAARVKKQILDNQEKWIEQNNLKEAFRYVNKVSSYCYHFGEDKK